MKKENDVNMAGYVNSFDLFRYTSTIKSLKDQLIFPYEDLKIRFNQKDFGDAVPYESVVHRDDCFDVNHKYLITFFSKKMNFESKHKRDMVVTEEQSVRYAFRMVNSLHLLYHGDNTINFDMLDYRRMSFSRSILIYPMLFPSPLSLDASLNSICLRNDLSKYKGSYDKLCYLYLQLMLYNMHHLNFDYLSEKENEAVEAYKQYCHIYSDFFNYKDYGYSFSDVMYYAIKR